ncbi:ATP-binding protein [Castellaniella ginsengisoli]|uniref:ATP-binding protein n=1 Tax=Castellaniella ginsengisoli TaxID=546114 RepID=A0AB39EYC4_9BURK
MNGQIAGPPLSSVRLRIPACMGAIAYVQHATHWFVEQAEMAERQSFAINLAIEELILTLLRHAFDGGSEQGDLEISIELHSTLLRLEVACRALPFDLSMVPSYQPGEAGDDASLSVLLLKHMVDRYHLHNGGRDGYRILLEWLRPLAHVEEMDHSPAPEGAAVQADGPVDPIAEIRPLREDEALALSRLVYRSYGYSYVSDFLYYPQRIVARLQDKTLHSWVAVSERGELAGHAALMSSGPGAAAVEWGIGVIDPRWRGQNLLRKLSAEVTRQAAETDASILFVHAVTNHPLTQKSGIRLGFQVTALLLGFAPADLEFRHIHDQLSQRESTFIGIRPLKPLPKQALYLPARHADTIRLLATGAGIALIEATALTAHPAEDAVTAFDTLIEPSVNVAFMNLASAGAELASSLAAERRRLCREKVDVIYLNIDLSSAYAQYATEVAEADGFFLAGLTPMQPWPYTLTLQYLNNLDFDYGAIHAVGEQAEWLKTLVRQEQQRVSG